MLAIDPHLDEPLQGGDLLRRLAEESAETGLPAPPVPREMVAAFRQLGGATFGTAELPHPLFGIGAWIAEAPRAAAYLFYGADGRGLTRQYLHYYLSAGPLLLLLQHERDMLQEPRAAPGFAETMAQVPLLLDMAERLLASGRLAPDERLVLVDSDFIGRRWGRSRAADVEIAWRDEDLAPIAAVMRRYRPVDR